jgi:hypothetical protein
MRASVTLALPALLLALAMSLGAPAAANAAQAGAPPAIVGAWLGVFPEEAGEPVPGRVLVNFNADGTLIVSLEPTFLLTDMGPAAQIYGTPGHGAWVAAGGQQYRARFVILYFDETGAYFGMAEIDSTLTLAADGTRATSRDSGRVVLADATVVQNWEDEPGPTFTRIRP